MQNPTSKHYIEVTTQQNSWIACHGVDYYEVTNLAQLGPILGNLMAQKRNNFTASAYQQEMLTIKYKLIKSNMT